MIWFTSTIQQHSKWFNGTPVSRLNVWKIVVSIIPRGELQVSGPRIVREDLRRTRVYTYTCTIFSRSISFFGNLYCGGDDVVSVAVARSYFRIRRVFAHVRVNFGNTVGRTLAYTVHSYTSYTSIYTHIYPPLIDFSLVTDKCGILIHSPPPGPFRPSFSSTRSPDDVYEKKGYKCMYIYIYVICIVYTYSRAKKKNEHLYVSVPRATARITNFAP